jgi:6,7-dimethyl-8-ribityllumazine synthase
MTDAILGHFERPAGRILVLSARFNSMVTDRLLEGALSVLERQGVSRTDIDIVKVPGAFEMPIVCQRTLRARAYAGVIALGAVIRGETGHYDFVAGGANQGLMQVSLQENVPVTFGILTCDTLDQAISRAGMTVGNKGEEAAMALVETLSVLRRIDGE